MSGLVANESGRVITTLGEEVNRLRQARAMLDVGQGSATLYVLARSHRPDGPPLEVKVGDRPVGGLLPVPGDIFTWHALELPEDAMRGKGITFSSSGDGMGAWSLGVDYTSGGDLLSTDGGRSWSGDRIGHLHVAPGRYVVRARVSEEVDPEPPEHVWERQDHPAVEEFRSRLPVEALSADDEWSAVRALSTWVSRSWVYRNTSEANQYVPWDPPTILDWGAQARGHAGQLPVAMCVHYAIVLAAACQALGIPARCAALTGSINGFNGHFVTEVWSRDWCRWVMVDPTYDVTVNGPDGPADLRSIRSMGADLERRIDAGPGIEGLMSGESGRQWFSSNFLQGVCFRNRSVWPRSDFLSRPDLSPPGHGATAYCELDLVWERGGQDGEFGMFRWFGGDDWFDAAPSSTKEVHTHDR